MECSSRVPDNRSHAIDRNRSIDLTSPLAGAADGYDSTGVLDALFMLTAIDVTKRKRMEASLAEQQSKFQALVADLATRCAAAKPDHLEAVIREALGDIAETLGVDRTIVGLPAADDASAVRDACEGQDRLSAAATGSKGVRQRMLGDRHVMYRDSTAGRAGGAIASDSVAIRRVIAQVEQVAPTTATVLLLGETGVGKEVFAQAIHNLSPRQRRTMIRVSCAAIPTALIESELFGRERGAFTGALSRQIGRFEAAHGSTIFLDEIGDLPLEVQVKLLRVLQERTVERLGANQSTKVDVRVIAATNKNLEQAVAANAFREDLFYRLNVFPITIPPLRDRVDDINALVWTFIDEFSQAFGKPIEGISKEGLAALRAYPWPGNVRELRNVIERAVIMATSPTLVVSAPSPVSKSRRTASSKLVDIQAAHITSVLASCRWRIRGSGGAAERLGLRPTTLESRMSRLGISREMGPTAGLARVDSPSPS